MDEHFILLNTQFTKCLVLNPYLLAAEPVSAHYQVHEVTHANFIEAINDRTSILKGFESLYRVGFCFFELLVKQDPIEIV